MVLDDTVFPDERQRLQHSTGMLMGAFFGCRLCSLFDTRIKLDPPSIDDLSLGDGQVSDDRANNKLRSDDSMDIDSGHKSNKPRKVHNYENDSSSDAKTVYDGERESDSDTAYDDDSDSDSSSLYDLDDDSDTDDECTMGSEETRSFLYRHFTIYIIPNSDPSKPNTIFTKIILIHTKGEDNNPRM